MPAAVSLSHAAYTRLSRPPPRPPSRPRAPYESELLAAPSVQLSTAQGHSIVLTATLFSHGVDGLAARIVEALWIVSSLYVVNLFFGFLTSRPWLCCSEGGEFLWDSSRRRVNLRSFWSTLRAPGMLAGVSLISFATLGRQTDARLPGQGFWAARRGQGDLACLRHGRKLFSLPPVGDTKGTAKRHTCVSVSVSVCIA